MLSLNATVRTNEAVPPGTRFAALPDGFRLKRGGVLNGAYVAYETLGQLAPDGSNAILILGGFSANAHVASHAADPSAGWWEKMVGPGRAVDTDRWFVICINALGSCFGSTGPASVNTRTGRKYRLEFPDVSIEDIAEAALCLVQGLGLRKLACVIGTSLGGMSALALLHRHPGIARTHINVSGAAQATSWAIGLRSLQRQAILNDPAWRGGQYNHATELRIGMEQARMLGMLSYRSPEEWQERFARNLIPVAPETKATTAPFAPEFLVEGYLRYKVDGFVEQYDPNCYLYLSRAIDRFDLTEKAAGDLDLTLSQLVLERALVIGTSSDILYPIWQQEAIAQGLARNNIPTDFLRLESLRGHDAFLADFDQFAPPLARFLDTVTPPRRSLAVL